MNKQIIGDFHLHSSFSGDCDSPMEDMILQGIENGLSIMCFTEHLDKDFPAEDGVNFDLDIEQYQCTLQKLQAKYQSKIELRFGLELGLQPHLAQYHEALVNQYPFDFIIGSSHLVHGADPYFEEYYEGRTEDEAYREYFESILENLDAFHNVNIYGHIDYVVRYGPNQNKFYSYNKFRDIIDEILKSLVQKGLGIECNTGGIKYGLGHPNPCEEILKRYRQLGGEMITIGSDAHTPRFVGYAFEQISDLLQDCGFRYYSIFKNRQPEFIPL